MAPEQITSERIYARLKADLMGGLYLPGEILVERRIAEAFGVSISPVRAGAYRLVGERMLEFNAGGGFRLPEVTEAGLRDLYFWHGQLIRNAVAARDQFASAEISEPPSPPLEPGTAAAAKAVFDRLALRSASSEVVLAVRAAGERLHAVRLRESGVLSATAEELAEVEALTDRGSSQDLLRLMWAYHRRRLRRIPELVTATHRPVPHTQSAS